VYRDGKIVDIVKEHRKTQSKKKTKAKSSPSKTTAPHRKAQSKKKTR
jgi:hypothetical protein